jgi:SRSO17 transposase
MCVYTPPQTTLIDFRLYLPDAWSNDKRRCKKAGIPAASRLFKSKSEQALEMVKHQRDLGVRFAWVGSDGGYG